MRFISIGLYVVAGLLFLSAIITITETHPGQRLAFMVGTFLPAGILLAGGVWTGKIATKRYVKKLKEQESK